LDAKEIVKSGRYLPVMEEFYSLQGEGYNTGEAAYFLRVGGCDVGCHFCDVKESWDADLFPPKPVDEVIERALEFAGRSVIVTGGEPLMYNLDYLCAKLKENRFKIFLETSGSHPVSGIWDWICLSPKKNAAPLHEIYAKAHELKVIIYNQSDFDWAEENARVVSANCKLYLQPEWSNRGEMMPLIVEYVKNNPKWKISLQTHKYMRIP
jgi:7-carboxy-7-deazaguanine synthase